MPEQRLANIGGVPKAAAIVAKVACLRDLAKFPAFKPFSALLAGMNATSPIQVALPLEAFESGSESAAAWRGRCLDVFSR